MAKHQVRRLPVIEDHTLVGMLAQADVALSLPAETSESSCTRYPRTRPWQGTRQPGRDHHREDQCA